MAYCSYIISGIFLIVENLNLSLGAIFADYFNGYFCLSMIPICIFI